MYQLTTLPSGLRVATAPMPHMESVTVGIWIGVGGRYEPARYSGISHFIEHLLFKGTMRRTAKQISEAVEGVGGYLNAFTSEETTCYYAKASERHLDVLFDVLSDMYRQPRFAPADIAKERRVIKEELLMYRDQPDHYVHELLTETLWPNQPLGRPLTGTPATLDALNRRVLLAYKARRYVAANTVVAVAGACTHSDVVDRTRRYLPLAGGQRPPRFLPARQRQRAPRLRYLGKNVEQSHLALGFRAYSRHDPRRFPLKLLSVLLGENMSSRLFQVIREEHGLAYSVQSSTTYLADTGVLLIAMGLDTARLRRALQLLTRELRRVARQPPAAAALRRAQDYAIGQMRIGLENTSTRMIWLGEHLLGYGIVHLPEEIERQLLAVTPAAIQAVAADVLQNHRLSTAIITAEPDARTLRSLLRL